MSAPIAVVSISGGKDSLATGLVARDTYGPDRVRYVWADTGHESEITVNYIRNDLSRAFDAIIEEVRADFAPMMARKRAFIEAHWEDAGVPAERVRRAIDLLHPTGNPFLDLCMWKGRFPSRKAQFCTEELKKVPLDLHLAGLIKQFGLRVESWQGVRREEGGLRKFALEWERHDLGCLIHRPILDWTAAEVFEFAERKGVSPNPLYLRGMKRVGCFPCINCGKDELLAIASRFPEAVARVSEWEALVSEVSKRGASTLFHIGADRDIETPAEIFARANIDEFVRWSKTSRGGKQFDLERALPPPACSSVYGLCE